MALNLTNIKAEADRDQIEKLSDEQKKQKIKTLSEKHKAALRELFNNLFRGEKVQVVNGGSQSDVSFGSFKISMFVFGSKRLPNGTVTTAPVANARLTKLKSDNVIATLELTDITDYLYLDENSSDYLYTYKINNQIKECKFSDIERLIQGLIDA